MIDWRAQHAMKNASDYLNYVRHELQNARRLQCEMIDTDSETADATEKEFDVFAADQIDYLISVSNHIREMIKIMTENNDTLRKIKADQEDT